MVEKHPEEPKVGALAGHIKDTQRQDVMHSEDKMQLGRRKPRKTNLPTFKTSPLKIMPLGGLGEIGKNLTAFEYENDIIVVDCGLAFPDEDMLGVDIVIPDITYLIKNKERVRAVLITHGHEDHIGGLAYFLKEINCPVYATKLTLGIAQNKLKEHGLDKSARLKPVTTGNVVKVGNFKVEFIGVNHSIPDSCAFAIYTPVGTIFHTGDFKLDSKPISGEMLDIARISQIGKAGVLLLMSESTNVEKPGYSRSEYIIGNTFNEVFKESKKRIVIATFSSNVHRIQQIINSAAAADRKVAINGRSMENIIMVATELGYVNIPKETLISINNIVDYPPEKLVIITTGSQGEPMSALTRMAFSEHKKIQLGPTDLVILSSSPIPGNEKSITRVVNELFRRGAEVIYDKSVDVHVSGHACQDELRLMIKLINPKYFMPIHGEYRMEVLHAKLAQGMGIPAQNCFVMDNGQTLELTPNSAKIGQSVPAGQVFVDGYGVGDVGNVVIRDRKHLAEDGLIIVSFAISLAEGQVIAGPDIISRGFVYVRESGDLINEIREKARNAIYNSGIGIRDWNAIRTEVRNVVGEFIYQRTKRKPMILPIILEV